MPHKNKIKGTYHEKKILEWFESLGLPVKKVPLSGSLGGEYTGDLWLECGGERLVVEVKYRDKASIPNPYRVIEDRDLAVIKRRTGRPQTLVIMTDETFAKLLGEPNAEKESQGG